MPEDQNEWAAPQESKVPLDKILQEASRRADEMLKVGACSALRQVHHHIQCAACVLHDNAEAIERATTEKHEG